MTRATGVLGNIRHQSRVAELNLIPRVSLLRGKKEVRPWKRGYTRLHPGSICLFFTLFLFFLGFCVALHGRETRARTRLVWCSRVADREARTEAISFPTQQRVTTDSYEMYKLFTSFCNLMNTGRNYRIISKKLNFD